MKKLKTYDDEFKKRAVEMIRHSGLSLAQIGRDLGCSATSLADWKRKYDDPLAGCIDVHEATPEQLKKENQRLLKELNIVKEQREILKKAAAILGQ